MSGTVLHLRAEKRNDTVTPTTTKKLLDAGYKVRIEESEQSIFDVKEFKDVGAEVVPTGSWKEAPQEHIIVGLKELPEEKFPLVHEHVQFAHVFKHQTGYRETLSRYENALYDLEFLQHENGRRVAAFGFYAGFAGAALALDTWAWQVLHDEKESYPVVKPYPNEAELITHVRKNVEEAMKVVEKKEGAKRQPQVLVIGALGRCGSGAVSACEKIGLSADNILKWDMAETAKGGPFQEIVESDVFVNCIYLMGKIPPFVTTDFINNTPNRKLSVVCDVACDPNSPFNPVPIYSIWTTFDKPTVPVKGVKASPPISVISIDHLPTLLPREASEAFSADLLPTLMQLKDRHSARVWTDAKKLFDEKRAELKVSS